MTHNIKSIRNLQATFLVGNSPNTKKKPHQLDKKTNSSSLLPSKRTSSSSEKRNSVETCGGVLRTCELTSLHPPYYLHLTLCVILANPTCGWSRGPAFFLSMSASENQFSPASQFWLMISTLSWPWMSYLQMCSVSNSVELSCNFITAWAFIIFRALWSMQHQREINKNDLTFEAMNFQVGERKLVISEEHLTLPVTNFTTNFDFSHKFGWIDLFNTFASSLEHGKK